MNQEKALKKSVINLYGLPSFGFQVMVNMEVFLFAAFLTDYAMIPAALAGTVLMITSIFDIVWVPTAGVILDKSNLKWGRYRSWLLVGPPFAALFFILQFSTFGSPTTTAILVSVGFIISHLIWNIFYAAHIALNNSMTTVREERISMSSNRGMFNAMGAIAFSYFGTKLIGIFGAATTPAMGYTLTTVLGASIMVASYYVLFFLTKDYGFHGLAKPGGQKAEKMSVKEMFGQIVVNPPLIGLMLAELGRYLGRFIIFGLAFYYFKYVINNMAGLGIFFTGLNVVTFIGALLANPLAKKFGEKVTYMISLTLFVIALFVVWALPMNYTTFLVVMFIGYLGYGMPDALGPAMYGNTADYGEWKTGKNARGFVMSLISMPIKTAVFIRSVIITAILTTAGYVADMAPSEQLIQGVKNGIALYPAIFILFGLIIIFFLYKITPEKQAEMQAEIAARKK